MSWLYSQALVAEYSEASCLDGEQSAPSSSTNTPAMFLWQGKTTDASNLSRFGMTCELFEGSRGEGLLTWFLAGFPAKTSAQTEGRTEKGLKENDPASGRKWPESLARYDRVSRSWKTAQLSLFGGLEPFSGTWPSWGMMRHGACFPLATLEHDTDVKGSGLLLGTPTKEMTVRSESFRSGAPTPREFLNGSTPNPAWIEWLMGWPLQWTALDGAATDKFRLWCQSHGIASREDLA